MCGAANAEATTINCPICNEPQPIKAADAHANQCLSSGGISKQYPPPPPQSTTSNPPVYDLTGSCSSSSSSSSSNIKQHAQTANKSLTSNEQVNLLQQVLNSSAPNSSILSAIKQHVDAEEQEERQSHALGEFQWQMQQRNGHWTNYASEHNVTIESERRRGNGKAQIIDTSGQTITIHFASNRDSRGTSVRALPKDTLSDSKSSTSSSSSSTASTATAATTTTFHFLSDGSTCGACMSSFDSHETVRCTNSGCGHSVLCTDCMAMYVRTKIQEKSIFPFIKCPDNGCSVDLSCQEILAACGTLGSSELCTIYLEKWIARYPEWTPCTSSSCRFGFLVTNNSENKRMACGVCNQIQVVKRRREEQDEGLKAMIADGTLRPCPKCQLLTMKEYGVCNVIECQQCSIVWNWKTKETGRTTKELKQRARSRGTLWEPGELSYQQNLQRTNKPEFIKLLERNGVAYDPNYRRGT